MALTKEDLQAIEQLFDEKMDAKLGPINSRLDSISEQQEVHTKAIITLENNVMHELGMLNELLPDALAKREAFEEVAATVDDHSNRISALEQKAANG